MKNYNFLRNFLFFSCALISYGAISQTTTRYHETVLGGVAMIGNSHYLKSTDFGGTAIVNDVDADATTNISSSSDLILPLNSTIDYAYLAIETSFQATSGDMTSVKFKVPGGNYITLTPSSSQFLANRSALEPSGSRKYRQMIFNVTDLIPVNGYVSTGTGGASGRYFVADPAPTDVVTARTNNGRMVTHCSLQKRKLNCKEYNHCR